MKKPNPGIRQLPPAHEEEGEIGKVKGRGAEVVESLRRAKVGQLSEGRGNHVGFGGDSIRKKSYLN